MTPTRLLEARSSRRDSPSSWSSSTDSEGRFPPGTVLAERYRIIGRLGRGGMGEVFRADDLKLGQPVALKFLPEKIVESQSALQRFHHEVKIARQVSHANVCRVYDIGEIDGLHFMSMEYVDGEDLRSLLKRIGRLPSDKALQIARQICAGLAAAHDKGVLHRDLKPANLMLDGEGTVRITDFGLAGLAGEIRGAEIRNGTPAYMAPEQLAGKQVSIASDIYALGLVLFELFTGKPAYRAETLPELLKLQQDEPTSPSSLVQDLAPAVERVILRCLARTPAERPSSALAVAAALPGGDPLAAALAAGETPSPELVAAAGSSGSLRPRIAWSALAAAVVLLAAILALAGPLKLTRHVSLPKQPAVLVAEAKQLLSGAGYVQEPVDSAWAFEANEAYLDHLAESDDDNPWSRLGPGARSGLLFWYRQSPYPLAPADARMHMMSADDPPDLRPGMASVWMDPSGRLISLDVVPPQVTGDGGEDEADVDWSALLSATGLPAETIEPAAPRWTPPVHSDAWQAWQAADVDDPSLTWHIEAAAFRGRPVHFRVVSPWEAPVEPGAAVPSGAGQVFTVSVALFMMAGAAFLAYRNVRQGRSDRKGAFRLLVPFVSVHMVAWSLRAMHPADAPSTMRGFFASLESTIFEASMIYCLYLALEPYVRRRWPDTLISWTRLLSGRLRDPLVGRDVLLGCTAGLGIQFLAPLLDLVLRSLAVPPPPPETPNLRQLLGGRFLMGEFLDNVIHVMIAPMIFLVLLVLLTIFLRRAWAGMIGLLVLFAVVVGVNADHWIQVLFAMLFFATLFLVIKRVGLLGGVVFFLVEFLTDEAALTLDTSAFYFAQTLVLAATLLALAVYGFFTSLSTLR